MSMTGYDSWLEAPYQRMYRRNDVPADAENYMGLKFWLDGDEVEVTDWECWEDADEDGRYGGVDLVVTLHGGRTQNLSPADLEEVLAHQDDHRGED